MIFLYYLNYPRQDPETSDRLQVRPGDLGLRVCVEAESSARRPEAWSCPLCWDCGCQVCLKLLHCCFWGEYNFIWCEMCHCGNFQVAALTAMGHFKAPTTHKQVCRSRSRDQSPSEFWNKVGKFFMWHDTHFIVVSVSSASWQIEREIFELKQSDEHWQVMNNKRKTLTKYIFGQFQEAKCSWNKHHR